MGNVEKRKQKKQGHLSLGKERPRRAGWIEVGGVAGRGEKGTLGDRDGKWKGGRNRKKRELGNPFCQSQ